MSPRPFLSIVATTIALFSSERAFAQFSFTERTSLLSNRPGTSTFHGGAPIAITDMNGDGRDDIIRLDQLRYLTIEFQMAPGEPFRHHTVASLANEPWAICIADVDKNGFNDIVAAGGTGGIALLKADAEAAWFTNEILPESDIFCQGTLFADINNDGWVDLFSCDDHGDPLKFRNTASGSLQPDQQLMETLLPLGNSGNYAAIWSDIDNDGDSDLYLSKCKSGQPDPSHPTRVNRLLRNDGSDGFHDAALSVGLADGNQSWCADFGDIDNDGDLDCLRCKPRFRRDKQTTGERRARKL